MTVSTLIAGFGLLLNSTAVVIGAMLVAPLITPIFGISLALVRGETTLLGRALRAEIVEVAAAVSMSLVLGLLLGDFEPTAEMLSRTRPTLFDLLVAVLAGFAGAYALVDEKIAPPFPAWPLPWLSFPPWPIAVFACLWERWPAGWDLLCCFLPIFCPFWSYLSHLRSKRHGPAFWCKGQRRRAFRRFQLPIVAFIVIAAFLGHSLYKIALERRMAKSIQETLIDQTSRIPSTALKNVNFYMKRRRRRIGFTWWTMSAPRWF